MHNASPEPGQLGTVRYGREEAVEEGKEMTLQDVVGQWRPMGDTCAWVDGPLYLAMKGGHPLLCDEMNLASSDIISFLVPLITNTTLYSRAPT